MSGIGQCKTIKSWHANTNAKKYCKEAGRRQDFIVGVVMGENLQLYTAKSQYWLHNVKQLYRTEMIMETK